MNKPYYVLIMILSMAFAAPLQSCLEENTDDCPPETGHTVRVVIRAYDDVDGASRASTIENIYLHIFDENDRYYAFWAGGEYTYGQTYEKYLDLEPGVYSFVAWSNQGATYSSVVPTYGPGDPAEQMIVALNYTSGTPVTDDVPDLHYGMLTDAHVLENTDNEFTITIRPNTYHLNFTVKGLTATQDEYSFTVRDNNSHYNYDNSFVNDADEFEYLRTATFSSGELASSMTVLRLADGRSPQFRFSNDTERDDLYLGNLIEMIKEAYARDNKIPDFENVFVYDIILTFGPSLLDVSVSVNGWGYKDNEMEL